MTVETPSATRDPASPARRGPAPEVWLAGAAPDTANLGVNALGYSVLHGIARRRPDTLFHWLDHGRGARRESIRIGDRDVSVVRRATVRTKRLWRGDAWSVIELDATLGLGLNRHVRALRRATALLDISGGDSFADLYGKARFDAVCAPKRLALRLRRPLVLLPQTYGPFRDPRCRSEAARLCRGAALAWARDPKSFAVLRELLGDRFDEARHRETVDVAFALPRTPLRGELPDFARGWFDDADSARRPVAGLNVSGLVFHDPDRARSAFGLRADYNELVIRLTERLAREANVLLVPHVNTPPGHYESDPAACEAVRRAVCERSPEAAPHVAVAPVCEDPCEIKDLIARCDWFCGTRMHSTIAALSSGVPTAAIAYSLKTAPVFATCDQEDEVVDPREHGEHDLVEALLSSFARRAELRSSLARRLPTVVAAAEECMDTIVDRVLGRATPAEMEHR